MSGTPQELPMQSGNRSFGITLAGKPYLMRQLWNDIADPPFYAIDIAPANGGAFDDGSPLLSGLPLVPGVDLLSQFGHLGIGGKLIVTSDRDTGEYPTQDGLGVTSHVFFIPD